MNQLRLTLWHDSDGTGELTAAVESGAYSGQAKAWFDLRQLSDFAASLRPFPIADPALIEGGFFGRDHKLAQCHVRIRISPFRLSGALLAHVELMTDSRESPDQDLQQQATFASSRDIKKFSSFRTRSMRLSAKPRRKPCFWAPIDVARASQTKKEQRHRRT